MSQPLAVSQAAAVTCWPASLAGLLCPLEQGGQPRKYLL